MNEQKTVRLGYRSQNMRRRGKRIDSPKALPDQSLDFSPNEVSQEACVPMILYQAQQLA